MAEVAAIAAVASVASIGMSAASSVSKGSAQQAANNFQADRAVRAAQFGEIQANLTDTTARENLNSTLANIDVIRAAGNVDPTSPTSAAMKDLSEMRSDRQRMAAVGSIKAQGKEDIASADYLRKAGDFAVSQSYLSAGLDVASGVAKATGKGGAFNNG